VPAPRIVIVGAASTEFGLATISGLFEERETLEYSNRLTRVSWR
jgi:hypothetical protein